MKDDLSLYPYQKKTRSVVIAHNLLNEPLTAIFFGFTGVILYKSLGATQLQITIFTILKPIVALFAFYWGATLHVSKEKLKENVILSGILSRVPFFFFPWINNPWLMIASAAFYMLFLRGGVPAWIEILRLNLPKKERTKIFSFALSLAFIEGGLIGLWMGPLMDVNNMNWRWIFPVAAFIGMLSTILQAKLPIYFKRKEQGNPHISKTSLYEKFVQPWKDAFFLIKRNKEFARFQYGFMMGGFSVMLIIPALPSFYVDVLRISYTELSLALLVFKGLGFVLSSSFWARLLNRLHIFRFMGGVISLFAIFPLFLIMAKFHISGLYIAFFVYGVAQAGSKLSWNLSGPLFSKNEDSSRYSRVNVLMVGLRGCVAPLLGGLLCVKIGATPLLFIGALISMFAVYQLLQWHKETKKALVRNLKNKLDPVAD